MHLIKLQCAREGVMTGALIGVLTIREVECMYCVLLPILPTFGRYHDGFHHLMGLAIVVVVALVGAVDGVVARHVTDGLK